jgi:uncharacterized membrane protein
MEFFTKIHIHAMLVHFPIALLVSSCILQALTSLTKNKAWQEAAWRIFILLTFLTPLAVASGWWEANRLNLHHPVVDRHKLLAFLTMGGNVVAWVILIQIKRRKPDIFGWSFMILNLILAILVSWTAFYGGMMVYEYGIGVNR